MNKLQDERDEPRIRQLFKQTFTLRRNDIAALPDGRVKDLIVKFPMLKEMTYVGTNCFLIKCSA